jgi:hypothetical protein
LNTRYFQKFDEIMEYLNQRNMIADVIIMSEDPDSYGTMAQDLRYVRYALARYAAFSNITWTLVNEWEYSKYGEGKEWYWDVIGEVVRNEDPWMEGRRHSYRPLSIHQKTYHTFKWGGSTWPVHGTIQDGVWNGHHDSPRFANGDQWGNYGIVQNLSLNIPVVNDECGYFGQSYTYQGISTVVDRDNLRRAMWGIYMAGGSGTLGDDTGRQEWLDWVKMLLNRFRGSPVRDAKPWLTAAWNDLALYGDISYLSDFWTKHSVAYWKMNSRNDLVVSGERVYMLCDARSEFIVYAAAGGDFELCLPPGTYRVSWFNPVTGEMKPAGKTEGSDRTGFSAPFPGDSVLRIVAD